MGAHYKGWREADAWARFWKGTSTAQDQASGLVAEEAVLGLTAGIRTAETDQGRRATGEVGSGEASSEVRPGAC